MQLNATKLANAAAITVFILYVICTLFVEVAPSLSMTILAGGMHIPSIGDTLGDIEITLGGFLLGLIPMLFYSYAGAYLVAVLYNRSIKS